jgi:hypothetical protein
MQLAQDKGQWQIIENTGNECSDSIEIKFSQRIPQYRNRIYYLSYVHLTNPLLSFDFTGKVDRVSLKQCTERSNVCKAYEVSFVKKFRFRPPDRSVSGIHF